MKHPCRAPFCFIVHYLGCFDCQQRLTPTRVLKQREPRSSVFFPTHLRPAAYIAGSHFLDQRGHGRRNQRLSAASLRRRRRRRLPPPQGAVPVAPTCVCWAAPSCPLLDGST